jgi:deazaflavin-dependent oxidoreductase (nitroreductase family)
MAYCPRVDPVSGGATRAPQRTRMWWLRAFATRVVNPVTRRFAGYLPGFGILAYRGRSSGRLYRTPVNVFRQGSVFTILLTYGSDAQWVKNVLAAGGCEVQVRGRMVTLERPSVIADAALEGCAVPAPVKWIARSGGTSEYLVLHATGEPAA